MGVTNEFERDLVNQSHLKHPGRIDMIAFQNLADAGDGSPGVQRCFRNYLHEGGMEKDLDLIAHGIIGTGVDINNVELQQLSNIGANTISEPQWEFLGNSDQDVRIADSPTFGGLSLTGNIALAANSITGNSVDINNAEMQQLSNIEAHEISNDNWGYLAATNQGVSSSSTPTFGELTLNGDLVLVANGITGTSVNINNAELQQLSNIGTNTVSPDQWGYITLMNQSVRNDANVGFGQITMSGNIIMGSDDITFEANGLCDGVDVSDHNHTGSTNGVTIVHDNTTGITVNSHHDESHAISGGTHTGGIAWAQVSGIVDDSGVGTASKLSEADHQHAEDGSTKVNHGNLSSVSSDQHHPQTHTHTHLSTTGRTVNDHHAQTHILNSHSNPTGNINMNGKKFTSLTAPSADTDSIRRQDVGIGNPSTTNQHSNSGSITIDNPVAYAKEKEVICYRNLKNITVKWEHYAIAGKTVYTKVYINGNAVGVEKSTASTSPVAVTDNITNIYAGDSIQIYAYGEPDAPNYGYVLNMEIRYDYFENND